MPDMLTVRRTDASDEDDPAVPVLPPLESLLGTPIMVDNNEPPIFSLDPVTFQVGNTSTSTPEAGDDQAGSPGTEQDDGNPHSPRYMQHFFSHRPRHLSLSHTLAVGTPARVEQLLKDIRNNPTAAEASLSSVRVETANLLQQIHNYS